jgi:hypothetical protein
LRKNKYFSHKIWKIGPWRSLRILRIFSAKVKYFFGPGRHFGARGVRSDPTTFHTAGVDDITLCIQCDKSIFEKVSYGFWDNQWFGRNQIYLKLKLGALQFMPGIAIFKHNKKSAVFFSKCCDFLT